MYQTEPYPPQDDWGQTNQQTNDPTPPAPGPERRPLSQLTTSATPATKTTNSTAATTTCRDRTSMQHATGTPALTHLKRREPTAKKHTGNKHSKQKLSQHQLKQQQQLHSANTTWRSTQRTHPRPKERGQLNLPTARTGERLNIQESCSTPS